MSLPASTLRSCHCSAANYFNRITTPNHQAQKLFTDDVNSTYDRIRIRTAEISKDRAANKDNEEAGGVEQIQLHAVEPGSQININVPQPNSSDEIEIAARAVFDSFPPNFQKALESGSLDRVNEVLGKMSVSEAEEVVEQLGDAGMLSMEKGVIDGTTEEGQKQLKEIERQAALGEDDEEGGVPLDKEAGLKEPNVEEKPRVEEEIEVADPD